VSVAPDLDLLVVLAVVTVWFGLTQIRTCTTGKGRVFTAQPRRANTWQKPRRSKKETEPQARAS